MVEGTQYTAIHIKLNSSSVWATENLLCPRLGAPQRPLWRRSASSLQRSALALERAHHKRRTNGPWLDSSSTSSERVAEVSPGADAASRKKNGFCFKDFGKTSNVSFCKTFQHMLQSLLLSKRLTLVAFEFLLANQLVGQGMIRQPAWWKGIGLNKHNLE